MKCLIDDCTKEARTRGLCQAHYISLTKAIKNGRTTWQMLEQFGMANPSKKITGNLAEIQLEKKLKRLKKEYENQTPES